MFERRLKIFIGALVLVAVILISRVFAVQVLQHKDWTEKAAGLLTKPQITETTRGRILDYSGRPLAIDTACTDACVDYRAIIDPPDPTWLQAAVTLRVHSKLGAEYRNAKPEQKKAMLAEETTQTLADIHTMWATLAQLNPQVEASGDSRAAMDEIRKSIIQSVQARRTWMVNHSQQRDEQRASSSSRLMQWLSGSTDGGGTRSVGALKEEQEAHVVLPAINSDTSNFLGKQLENFPGLVLRASTHRSYPQKYVACHILGRLSHVSANDLEQARKNNLDDSRQYLPNDLIGREGVEALCEPLLRGARGKNDLRVSDNTIIDQQDFVPGSDVRLSIDADLQAKAQELLQHVTEHVLDIETKKRILVTPEGGVSMHGAIVVLDIKTNEVRVMASNPGFDVNELQDRYSALAADELNGQLINRATSDTLEPGSTVKPMIGLGAITQGALGPTEPITCTGCLFLPEVDRDGKIRQVYMPNAAKCWIISENPNRDAYLHEYGPGNLPGDAKHGPLIFADALMQSCDVFFETTADRLKQSGVDYWMDQFGLGRPTGIGIYERSGVRPGSFKTRILTRTDICLAGMGQGMVLATPLQIANEAATIARGGIWMRPRLLTTDSQAALDAVHPRPDAVDAVDLHLSTDALRQAHIGMVNVVEAAAGTGKIDHNGFTLAAKTGTADASPLWVKVKDDKGNIVKQKLMPLHPDPTNPSQDQGVTPWYRSGNPKDPYGVVLSWYMGYSPAENPQVAFCVLIEYAGAGGSAAAGPIAGQMLEACDKAGYLQPK